MIRSRAGLAAVPATFAMDRQAPRIRLAARLRHTLPCHVVYQIWRTGLSSSPVQRYTVSQSRRRSLGRLEPAHASRLGMRLDIKNTRRCDTA